MNGLILIDKPKDFTSFDVVAVMRKLSGQKKAGHTGTLDPNATGVLPILLGSATKAQDLIVNHDKTYVADFKLGITTDTLDIWGNVTADFDTKADFGSVKKALLHFEGEIEQIPPMFSAVQKDGKRLYDLARQGIEVERESRKVTVYGITLLDFDESTQSGSFEISCSKGTYVRTVIDDMGRLLKTGAIMTDLRRTQACGFSVDECISLDEAKRLAETGRLESALHSVESLFDTYNIIKISQAQSKRFSNGGALDLNRTVLKNQNVRDKTIFRVSDNNGGFIGLGITDAENRLLKIYKLFDIGRR
ncbi:MAG: tRNA pseudouridine(55) synthase TruB [Clostridia bacterium]|nr:tRNA pseudouridine(55) synthase TruB [Clostridia bacterium]